MTLYVVLTGPSNSYVKVDVSTLRAVHDVAYLLYSICCAYSVCRSVFTVPIKSLGMFAHLPTGMLETHKASCSQERYSIGLGSLHAVAFVPAKPSAGVLPSANSSLPLTCKKSQPVM